LVGIYEASPWGHVSPLAIMWEIERDEFRHY